MSVAREPAEKMEDFWAGLMPMTYDAFNKNGRVSP